MHCVFGNHHGNRKKFCYIDCKDRTIVGKIEKMCLLNLIFNKMGVFQENESFKRDTTIQRAQILVS